MPGELRAPLIVVENVAPGGITASIRASLVVAEPLADHFRQLLASTIISEPLADHFRTLRCPLLCVEALHPVPPEGPVSTELFPGSLGSSDTLPGLAFTVHKRPTFSTAKYKGSSGFGVRRANMQYPIWEFELTYEFLRSDVNQEYQTLCGFFLSRLGGFDTFLFKDVDDYSVVGGSLGIADGVTTQFGFLRTMGGFAELVGQVDDGNPINVYVDGVLQTLGVDYTIALPNHVVFMSAPADTLPVTADFQFFFNCTFKEDVADFDKFANNFWELQQIVLETVPQ